MLGTTYQSPGLVVMQVEFGAEVGPFSSLLLHAVHEVLGFEIAVADVIPAPSPLPLAVRADVLTLAAVVTGALHQQTHGTRLGDGVHSAGRRDGVHKASFSRV